MGNTAFENSPQCLAKSRSEAVKGYKARGGFKATRAGISFQRTTSCPGFSGGIMEEPRT